MPISKQDIQRAVRLLQAQQTGTADPAVAAAAESLSRVLGSKLFYALLELQQSSLPPHTTASTARSRSSLDPALALRNGAEVSLTPSSSNLSVPERAERAERPAATEADNTRALISQATGARPRTSRQADDDLEWDSANDLGHSVSSLNQIAEDPRSFEDIQLQKGPQGLGFSIHGGKDKMHVPGNPSIFVTAIIPGGLADLDKRLQEGDKILSVNGISLDNVTHGEAVRALKMSGAVVELRVQHKALQRELSASSASSQRLATPASTTTIEEVVLVKGDQGLGFSIAGGAGSPHLTGDSSIYITKVIDGSVADRDGRLAAGDRLLEVNGQSCVDRTHDLVVGYLKMAQSGQPIRLKVDKHAFQRNTVALARSLGFEEAPKPRFTRTGTLKGDRLRDIPLTARGTTRGGWPVRTVTLSGSTNGCGFNIVGPAAKVQSSQEPSGIFVSRVIPGGPAALSEELVEGDQILSVNGVRFENLTHNEAVAHLRQADRAVMTLEISANPDVYAVFKERMALLANQLTEDKQDVPRTGFYVRALFDYNAEADTTLTPADRKRNILSFKMGDIMQVMSVSDSNWWDARMHIGQGSGVIPSRRRREESEKKHSGGGARTEEQGGEDVSSDGNKSRKRLYSFKLARRFSFRKKKEDKTESVNGEDQSTPAAVLSYEIVELRQQQMDKARPVMVLGPSKDLITDQLVADFPDLFGSCVPHTTRPPREHEVEGEDYFFVTREKMEVDLQAGYFVEAGQYNGNFYGTSLHAVRLVAAEARHCLLDVSAHSIRRLKAADIHPISIFLKPGSPEVVRTQNPNYSEEMAKNVYALALRVHGEFRHQFTEAISNDSFDKTYQRVVEIVRRESRDPYWASTGLRLP